MGVGTTKRGTGIGAALLAAGAAHVAHLATASVARADGAPLRPSEAAGVTIKIDGLPKEFGGFFPVDTKVKGQPDKADLSASVALAYDDANLYVAADVTDDKLKGGGDKVVVVVGFPGGAKHEVTLAPGEPGKSASSAKLGGKALAGAKIVEAEKEGGWTLEAQIPWSAFPQSKTVKVGLRGAVFVHDADGGAVDAVVGTASSTEYPTLPPISLAAEQALGANLLREKGLTRPPQFNLVANVAGDGMSERVLVYDKYLVVLGSNYRSGGEYYFQEVATGEAKITGLELKELTGDGRADLLLKKRIGSSTNFRDSVHVLSFGGTDTPSVAFQHETGVTTPAGSIDSGVVVSGEGDKALISVVAGKAKGFTAANYKEGTEADFAPVLLPWGTIKSRTFKFNAGTFIQSAEETQPGVATAAAAKPAAPTAGAQAGAMPKPTAVSSSGSSAAAPTPDKVLALYKRDRGVTGAPRFDLKADVADDKTEERIVLFDRELVVFGQAYKNGTAYASLTINRLADAKDIKSVTTKDANADGKAEIVVKGVVKSTASKALGGGTVERDVVLLFETTSEGLRGVFAAEVGRSQGANRIEGTMKFVTEGKKPAIELAPGKATGWTEQTYPYGQDTTAVGGFEPLLLPWGGAKATRYVWDGAGFTK